MQLCVLSNLLIQTGVALGLAALNLRYGCSALYMETKILQADYNGFAVGFFFLHL